jgi:aromatic ring hydroxylase-like protein
VFLLLDRTPDGAFARVAADRAGRVRTVTDDLAPRRVGATPTGVLVRPDGVVAWATDTTDVTGLDAALHRWTGAPAAAELVPAGAGH